MTVEILLEIIVGLVLLGAVPWAYSVGKKLSAIEATLKTLSWQEKAIDRLQEDVREMQLWQASRGNNG